jgi:hypothetical protein
MSATRHTLSRLMPAIAGRIARRILVNYRVKLEALAPLLPQGFRPKQVRGRGMAGICLIRLEQVRPRGLPRWCGVSSENAAHRIAVEWDEDGVTREGVFIPRRDTNRWFNRLAGGRLFPGCHHRAEFEVCEDEGTISVDVRRGDGAMSLKVSGRKTNNLSQSSVFSDLDEASAFFQAGALGWSPTSSGKEWDGLELHCPLWRMAPLEVTEVHSSFFDPLGDDAQFDSAFLMLGLDHEWHAKGRRPMPNVDCDCLDS